MAEMCISVVGGDLSAAQINAVVNSNGGVGQAPVSTLPIIDKCPLEKFCISNGEYGAHKCIFPVITSNDEPCGVVVHECGNNAVVEDWKPYGEVKSMLTCEDGRWCFEFNCWSIGNCPKEPEPEFKLSKNPCVACDQIEDLIFQASAGGDKSSERKGVMAATYCKPNIPALEKLLLKYQKRCRRKCGRSGRRWTQQIRPHCTSR